MRSVNRAVLLGRVAAPPELRDTVRGKPVANFELETVEEWRGPDGPQSRKTLHVCTAFGPIARTVERTEAGDYLYVEGALRDDGEVVCFVAIPVADPDELDEAKAELTDLGRV